MKSELKKEYALRISQANNVEMILIAYEMVLTYVNDALDSKEDTVEYGGNLRLATRCMEELMNNLHYEYEFAKSLKELYLYVKKLLRDAAISGEIEKLEEVKKIIGSLHDSYEQIKDQDPSDPLMKNTQSVIAGMTYGKNQILDELSNDVSNRGFTV